MQHLLWKLLKVAWRNEIVLEVWARADGVYIPKEGLAFLLNQFCPISVLSVEGKIMLSIIATHLAKCLIDNGSVEVSIDKAGLPGFTGCLEYFSMIWHTIQMAKADKSDLAIIWLDLAIAYGVVPHRLTQFTVEFFHVPEKARRIVAAYYSCFKMRFAVAAYTINWQDLMLAFQWVALFHPFYLPLPCR